MFGGRPIPFQKSNFCQDGSPEPSFFMEIFMSEAKKPVPVRLVYDVWFRDDVRTAAGAIVSLSLDEAKALIAAGKAERADPLPGE